MVAGRRPYFYTYDTATGATAKVPGLKTRRDLSSHEHMTLSPEGSRIAFIGSSGYVHVLDGKQKTWTADVTMNRYGHQGTHTHSHTLSHTHPSHTHSHTHNTTL
jgi:hypothetical protein